MRRVSCPHLPFCMPRWLLCSRPSAWGYAGLQKSPAGCVAVCAQPQLGKLCWSPARGDLGLEISGAAAALPKRHPKAGAPGLILAVEPPSCRRVCLEGAAALAAWGMLLPSWKKLCKIGVKHTIAS